jgi:3-methyladenine DNA glycosylase AlkC
MFKLIREQREQELIEITRNACLMNIEETARELTILVRKIREEIPEKKRISYGRYSIIKKAGKEIHSILKQEGVDINEFCESLFALREHDEFIRSAAVRIMAVEAEATGDLRASLDLFKQAAEETQWIIRECSAGFVRPLAVKYPEELHSWYMHAVKSDSPLLRRFASESLRPVVEFKKMHNNPDFFFSVIENLFEESVDYPRTSAGNSLSDWMRINPEYTLPIVKKLATSGNKNSYWIAYRACRNYIKTHKEEVMDLLDIDEYKYKSKVYRRD